MIASIRSTWRNLVRTSDCRAVVLMYHRVAEMASDPWSLAVTPQHFAEHLQVLRSRTLPLKMHDIGRWLAGGPRIAPRSAAVTFDDGYSDNFRNARPLLERHAVPATIFLATGYLGSNREYWWDELERLFLQPGSLPPTLRLRLNGTPVTWELADTALYTEVDFQLHRGWRAEDDPPTTRQQLYRSVWQAMQRLQHSEQQRVMSELMAWSGAPLEARSGNRPMTNEEIAALGGSPLFELAAHTVTHPVLSTLTAAEQEQEIGRSKSGVEEIAGVAVTSFAYPYGDYNQESVAIVRESRFTAACSTVPGAIHYAADPFCLPRIHVGNWSGEEFGRQLSKWLEK